MGKKKLLKSPWASSRVDVELKTNVSEISSVSIIRVSGVNVRVKVKVTLRLTVSQTVLM
jgi:hypothetical protein